MTGFRKALLQLQARNSSDAIRVQIARQDRKEDRRCWECNKPLEDSHATCPACRDARTARARRRAERILDGLDPGDVYVGTSGPSREVVYIDQGMVGYKLNRNDGVRICTLARFATWAIANITDVPSDSALRKGA